MVNCRLIIIWPLLFFALLLNGRLPSWLLPFVPLCHIMLLVAAICWGCWPDCVSCNSMLQSLFRTSSKYCHCWWRFIVALYRRHTWLCFPTSWLQHCGSVMATSHHLSVWLKTSLFRVPARLRLRSWWVAICVTFLPATNFTNAQWIMYACRWLFLWTSPIG